MGFFGASLGWNLLVEAYASIRVPFTLKCSSDRNFDLRACFTTPGKEHTWRISIYQSLHVGGEGGLMPDLLIKGQSDKPAEQDVVAYLLHQQTVTLEGIECLEK